MADDHLTKLTTVRHARDTTRGKAENSTEWVPIEFLAATQIGAHQVAHEALRSSLQARAHGQTNPGVSDPAISRAGRHAPPRAGSLTPGFVRCRHHKPRSRAAQNAARFQRHRPTHRLAPQVVIAVVLVRWDHESTRLQMLGRWLQMRTTSDCEVVPQVVLCSCEIRRRQPGRRDGSTGASA